MFNLIHKLIVGKKLKKTRGTAEIVWKQPEWIMKLNRHHFETAAIAASLIIKSVYMNLYYVHTIFEHYQNNFIRGDILALRIVCLLYINWNY